MAKLKKTKVEMKAQKDALKRYERFLPMLQLKKQQLQVEIQGITAKIDGVFEQEFEVQADLDNWISLLSEPIDLTSLIAVEAVNTSQGNIAGVSIPILEKVTMKPAMHDLFDTPPWVDDAIKSVGRLIELQIERKILERQRALISEELRLTSQRVNLFEKVKIPECKENIRIIKIFLGDEQTAAVARGKIAKRRSLSEEPVEDAASAWPAGPDEEGGR
jgi:V/A-type H+-transporting ATPase subunit D